MTTIDVSGLDPTLAPPASPTALELLDPADPGYDRARLAWNTAFEHRPPLIARPASADEVVAAVLLARDRGLPIAIQSTGHGPVREATDALLIDLSRLDHVEVDVERRRAVIAGGAKWSRVLDAATRTGSRRCSGRRRMSARSATRSVAGSAGSLASTAPRPAAPSRSSS